jgi:hypothetical protein
MVGVRLVHLQLVATVILLLAAACTGAPRADSPPGAVPPSAPTPAPTPAATPAPATSPGAPTPAPSRSLIEAVRRDGTVRVIVTLAVRYTPEGHLPGAEAVRRQRAEIATAQDRLLDELRPFHTQLHARYAHTPQLALTVDEAALLRMLGSPLVLSVQRDTPQGATT